MTKAELADKAGLTPAAITQFEEGDRVPSAESLKKLSDVLKVSIDYLLGSGEDAEFLKNPQMQAMFRGMKKLAPEDFKLMRGVYEMLLERNKAKKKPGGTS
jgi:transcriptional regulator with XRE-family HTH domain